MNQKLKQTLNAYLEDKITPVTSHLGLTKVSEKQKQDDAIFIARLEDMTKFSKKIVVTVILLIIAVIVFIGIIIWHNNTNKALVFGLLTGESGGVFIGIRMIMRLKREELFSLLLIDQFQKAESIAEKKELIRAMEKFLYGK